MSEFAIQVWAASSFQLSGRFGKPFSCHALLSFLVLLSVRRQSATLQPQLQHTAPASSSDDTRLSEDPTRDKTSLGTDISRAATCDGTVGGRTMRTRRLRSASHMLGAAGLSAMNCTDRVLNAQRTTPQDAGRKLGCELGVDATGSGPCPVAGSGTSGVEPSSSATRDLVN
jgi:hypothetical protein